MALQSEVSPPMVGDPTKDIKIEGDTKSDENDSSQSSDEDDVDLEEGEILDSGAEEEKEKDFSNSSLKDALDKNCLQNIEQLINQSNIVDNNSPNHSKSISSRKMNKRPGNYIDHDQEDSNTDQNDAWLSRSPKHKKSERTIDYRNELEAYRGTPPSSPDRKKRDGKSRRKKSSKKSKKSSRKTITRKDAKGQRVMRYKKDAARGKPCKYFKEGNCAKGSDCPFSHSMPEQKFRKKELCKFYLSGHCNKGKTCIYMHGEFPCKFYHTGSVCYAKEDCRFSHAPLTDEMKKVLADYLRQVHGDRDHHRDDDFHHREEDNREHDRGRARERKRHHSRSPEPLTTQSQAPPPPKRVCLLGSPPRQIRESEETKRWQEEMKSLQHQNLPGFEINLVPGEENMPPTNFPRPNFYQETLLNSSPKKHPIKIEGSTSIRPPGLSHHFPHRNFHEDSPMESYPYEEEFPETERPPMKEEPSDDFDWGDSQNTNDSKPNRNLIFNDNSQSDLDFTSDVKFDETTQFSEMESSTDGPPIFSSKVEKESESSNQDASKSSDAGSVNTQSQEQPPVPPIVIPSHLPRKQRELFMRVQQHNQQKLNLSTVENTECQIKKESDEEDEKTELKTEESKWYSSEDDDDDSDELLTDVLKKIQQGPPLPKPAEKKPAVDLMEMLNKIQQNTLEKNKTASNTQQPNLLEPFLKNILGSVPAPSPVTTSQAPIIPDTKRRTLLPDPILPVSTSTDSLQTKEITPKDIPKDPRLKNRDPRTLASLTNSSSTPKQMSSDRNNIGNNSPILDVNSLGLKPLPTVTNETQKESIPYRLHNIYAKPPNYTPYLHASQSNPKLLNDPRLRKHLQPSVKMETHMDNGKDTEISKPPAPKDAPPIPELLLRYEKVDSFINIFESNSSNKISNTTPDNKHPLPMAAQRVCDPRTIRRDSRSNSGSDTPPHLTIIDTIKSPSHQEFKSAPVLENALMEPISEKKKFPPILEKNWTPPILEKHLSPEEIKKELDSDSESNHEPPKLECSGKTSFVKSPSPEREFIAITKESPQHDSDAPPVVPPLIIKKIKPTLASHLPRAIADPRMAKLHNPVDPRRLRLASSENRLVERKKQPVVLNTFKSLNSEMTKESDTSSLPEASKSLSGEVEETVEKEDKSKSAKSIPKKRRLSDKSEEKKRTVHRNRKSSMDYASPLNSCDVTVPQKNSGYNSYNQRPKRNTNPLNDKVSTAPVLSSTEPSDCSSIPSFLPNNNSDIECDNNCDGSLKDRFKTIDPTASPFC